MDQTKKKFAHEGQFEYLGRWVDKANFRAFVYDDKGNQMLAGSHKEFESLTHSGLWFAEKPESIKPEASKQRKQKYDAAIPNS